MEREITIWAVWEEYSKIFNYSIQQDIDMSRQGWLLIEKQKVHFATPGEKELRLRIADCLRMKKIHMRATAEAAINEVEGQIQELLALEDHSKEVVVAGDEDDIPF